MDSVHLHAIILKTPQRGHGGGGINTGIQKPLTFQPSDEGGGNERRENEEREIGDEEG